MSLTSVFGNILQSFIIEPPVPGCGQVYEDSRRFRRGLALSKTITNIVLPQQLVFFLEAILLTLVTLDALLGVDVDWTDKIAEFFFINNTLIFLTIPFFNREEIDRLSNSVDFWWTHNLLEQEREELKKKSVQWIEKFVSYFYSMMGFACVGYCLIPLIKFIIFENKSYSGLYIFRLWAPYLEERLWVFSLLYFLQVACIFFQFCSYGVATAYMMSIAVACRYQTQLVEISCLSIQRRVISLMSKMQGVSDRKTTFRTIFLKEIAESARHYQHVYSNWKDMCRIFSRMADVIFYSGMCIAILFGARVVTKPENKFMLITSIIFIVVVISNQYLFTIINDTFTNQVISLQSSIYNCNWCVMPVPCQKSINLFQIMVSHVPTISTFMGIEASREFFSKTVNATYCYMSTLISMK